jgi:subtilisin family serine protease
MAGATREEIIAAIRADAASLPQGSLADGGAGVVIGFIDQDGLDYRLPATRLGAGTRLLALWDTLGEDNALEPDNPADPYVEYYGGRYSTTEIEGALAGGSPLPVTLKAKSHGHAVLDLAAGPSGLAPKSDLVFVSLPNLTEPIITPYRPPAGVISAETEVSSYGDLTELSQALIYIFNLADERPCVVNVSMGATDGPHDGTSTFDETITRLVNERPNRAVVISAGNYADDEHLHGELHLMEGEATSFVFRLEDNDRGYELDLWYSGADELEFTLESPDGDMFGPFPPGTSQDFRDRTGVESHVWHQLMPRNGSHQFNVNFAVGVTANDWLVHVIPNRVSAGRVNAWLYPETGARLELPGGISLVGLACCENAIVVGAHDHSTGQAAFFSGRGPTRDGRKKPDLCAPGVELDINVGASFMTAWGTSYSAPLVTGAVALMLAEAQRRGLQLRAAEVRAILTTTADAPAGWDLENGAGHLDVGSALRTIIDRADRR